jgi:hypothetical protein
MLGLLQTTTIQAVFTQRKSGRGDRIIIFVELVSQAYLFINPGCNKAEVIGDIFGG